MSNSDTACDGGMRSNTASRARSSPTCAASRRAALPARPPAPRPFFPPESQQEDPMNKRHLLAAGLLAVASALAPAAYAQEPMKLKVASNYPATSLFSRVQKHMLDEVTKTTRGGFPLKCYWGGVPLKAGEVFPGGGRGAADTASPVPAAFNPREYPISGVTLPFLTENVQ